MKRGEGKRLRKEKKEGKMMEKRGLCLSLDSYSHSLRRLVSLVGVSVYVSWPTCLMSVRV